MTPTPPPPETARECARRIVGQYRNNYTDITEDRFCNLEAHITSALEQREQLLRNLLARIHGDGGHYTAEHGLEKSVADADVAYVALYERLETAEGLLRGLRSDLGYKSIQTKSMIATDAFLSTIPATGPSSAELLREVVLLLKDFESGFDCDTGANGVHPHYCRCCRAKAFLARVQGGGK